VIAAAQEAGISTLDAAGMERSAGDLAALARGALPKVAAPARQALCVGSMLRLRRERLLWSVSELAPGP